MSEKQEIKRFGGKAQKNSGRGQIQKGDARVGPFIVDIKEYPKGYRIDTNNWAKICADAIRSHGTPALNLVIGEEKKVRLWVVEEDVMQEYLDWWRKKND